MATYIVLLNGNALLNSLSLKRLQPAPTTTKDLTAGPWLANQDPATGQRVFPEFPAAARFQRGISLGGPGSHWELQVEIRSQVPAQLDVFVLEEPNRRVICRIRPRLQGAGKVVRAGDFNL